MLQIIIFSKDRAMQLDALLRSIYYNVIMIRNIVVIYTSSSKEYSDGYKLCKERHPDISWYPEHHFKNDVCSFVDNNFKFTTFMVDDDIVIGTWAKDALWDKLETCGETYTLAHRLGKHINWNYVNNNSTPAPDSNTSCYRWQDHPPLSDWGYPMSIQGNVFRTSDLREYVKKLNFNCPNAFEGSMYHHPLTGSPFVLYYDKAKIIGLQVNRVASTSTNRHMKVEDMGQITLNKKWLDNKRINLQPIFNLPEQKSPDIDYSFEFEVA